MKQATNPNANASPELLSAAKLRYSDDSRPGIQRKKQGKSFIYFDAKGKAIRNKSELNRIVSIGLPPAYKNVWICPYPNGHIQAVGYDERGRKQYRYHSNWRAFRDENKFQHILLFAQKLSVLRERVDHDLKLKGLPRDKVLAAVVKLLEITLIRVGNSQYAKENSSYGLTTLLNKHVEVEGTKIIFQFKGKSGKKWNLSVNDRRIAAITKKCAEIPGQELYKYTDENGEQKDVTSTDVNNYLREITGQTFSAKDFRTWTATVLAAMALNEFQHYDSETAAKRNVTHAIKKVASQLGNTPAICRKCYVHPEIINAYFDGELITNLEKEIDKKLHNELKHLTVEEIMVLAFLRKRLELSR